MRIELGDHVLSQDGHDIGTIKHLILAPATGEVKTLVVEKGLFLPDDVEVPLNAFQDTPDSVLRVSYSAEQVHALPRFDEQQYTPAPPTYGEQFPDTPMGGLLWPGGYVGQPFASSGYPLGGIALPLPLLEEEMKVDTPPEVASYHHQQDIENVIISVGDAVYSRDGEKVGEVHGVAIDSVSGKPTAIVVRKGWLFVEDTTLMADAIASIDDGAVTLNMDRHDMPA